MNKWKDNDLEKIEIKIKIPKNTIAFIVNTISQEKNKISMSNTQYDSNDVEKLKTDLEEKVESDDFMREITNLRCEKEQLNSLVNSCQEEIRRLKKQLQERPKEYVFIGNAQNKTRDFINQITKDNKEFKTQQKEFIEYMNKTIEELECDDVGDEEMKGYLIQRLDIFKEILKKYNEKVTDINVGSIGDERNEKIL